MRPVPLAALTWVAAVLVNLRVAHVARDVVGQPVASGVHPGLLAVAFLEAVVFMLGGAYVYVSTRREKSRALLGYGVAAILGWVGLVMAASAAFSKS